MGELREIFGLSVRAARRQLGISQHALARQVGLKRTQIVNIEAGRSLTSFEKAIRLSVVLDLDLKIFDEFIK